MPTLTQVIFYGAAGLAVLSALLVVLMKDAVRSALFLVVTFFCLAVIYVLLNAQFIAAVQVIVYAGAIMVLFLFVIMLMNAGSTGETVINKPVRRVVGAVVALLLLGQLLAVAFAAATAGAVKGKFTQELIARAGHSEAIGTALFTKYLFPFEAISVLLLMAIIGAVVLAKKKL